MPQLQLQDPIMALHILYRTLRNSRGHPQTFSALQAYHLAMLWEEQCRHPFTLGLTARHVKASDLQFLRGRAIDERTQANDEKEELEISFSPPSFFSAVDGPCSCSTDPQLLNPAPFPGSPSCSSSFTSLAGCRALMRPHPESVRPVDRRFYL